MQLNDFEAHVTVDGVEMPEYNLVTDHDGNKITCWIPSDAGKCFTVTWKPLKNNPYSVAGNLVIDGRNVGAKFQPANSMIITHYTGAITSPTKERPFLFSSLDTTDDDRFLNNDGIKDLGDIALRIHEVVLGGTMNLTFHDMPLEKVHERSKKALAHRVKLGEEKKVLHSGACHAKYIRILATFTFRYRSIDILRAEGIAPPAPSTLKTSGEKRKADVLGEDEDDGEDQDLEETDQAELKALLAQVNTINEKVNTIQSKMTKKGSNSRKKVKTEARLAFVPGEVIDLT